MYEVDTLARIEKKKPIKIIFKLNTKSNRTIKSSKLNVYNKYIIIHKNIFKRKFRVVTMNNFWPKLFSLGS